MYTWDIEAVKKAGPEACPPFVLGIGIGGTFDYAAYLVFDGAGTISELGSFNVPDPAGTYSVDLDCFMAGEIWDDYGQR